MIQKESKLAEEFVLYTSMSIFLTGKAGTGKTTLLKTILKKTKKNAIVVAPTGVAAINAGGVTIHSMFQLPPSCFIPTKEFFPSERVTNWTMLAKGQKLRKEQRQLLIELDLLVIDEISMVRADLLDAIDYTLRRIRKNAEAFGGVQLLVIGDLFQLAPVAKELDWQILSNFYESPFFFDAHSWNKLNPIVIELQHVYRQEDVDFITILNKIRNGRADQNDIDRLNQNFEIKGLDKQIIQLTTHNFKANKINSEKLKALQTKDIKLTANVTGLFSESSYPTPEMIHLKEGAQIMFIRNDPDGEFFNGKIGIVEHKNESGLSIFLPTEDRSINVNRMSWENIKYHIDKKTKEVERETCGTFEQFPLRLAWAVTVHKSQGLTFEELIVDLEDSFAAGQLYVALSRCKSLEGLYLSSKLTLKNIIIDKRIKQYYAKALSVNNLDQILSEAKIAFDNKKLIDTFSFDKIIAYTESWEDYLINHNPAEKANAIRYSKTLFNTLDQLRDVAQKFMRQLDQLQKTNQSSETIIERTRKAISYFTEELFIKIIQPLEQHISEWKTKDKSRSYVNASKDLCRHFWDKMNTLYTLSFNGELINKNIARHKPVKYFDPDKPKRKVGETYEITMKLFDKGLNIDEIAKERKLSKGTIEQHMSRFIKEGKVDIDDLLDDKRIKQLQEFMHKRVEMGSNELMQACPFEISYTEIRWMKNWLNRNSTA